MKNDENKKSQTEGKPSGELFTIKQKYDVTCPHCGAKAVIGPSLFMVSGIANLGSYVCPKCGERVRVKLADGGERMDCEK